MLSSLRRESASVDKYLESLKRMRGCCVPVDVDYEDAVALDLYDIRLSFLAVKRVQQSRIVINDWRTFYTYEKGDDVRPVLGHVTLCADCHREVYGLSSRRYNAFKRFWEKDKSILEAPYNYGSRNRSAPMESIIIRHLQDLWEVSVMFLCVLSVVIFSSYVLCFALIIFDLLTFFSVVR